MLKWLSTQNIDLDQISPNLPQRAALAGVAVSFLVALCFPFIRLGLEASTPMIFAAWRTGGAGLILLIVATLTGRTFPKRGQDWQRIVGVSIFATTIGFAAMFFGGSMVAPGLATVIANTQPLFAALLAMVFLREKLGMRMVATLLFCLIGVWFMASPQVRTTVDSGALLLLLSAVALASGNVLLKKLAAETDPIMVSALQLLLATPCLVVLAWVNDEPFIVPQSPEFWMALFVLAGASTALAAVLWQWALARAPLNQINAVNFLVPSYGLLLMRINGVAISWSQWLGGVIAVGGVLLVLGQKPTDQP